MTLVRDGKIDLDRPFNDYLGDAVITARIGRVQDATVRRTVGGIEEAAIGLISRL